MARFNTASRRRLPALFAAGLILSATFAAAALPGSAVAADRRDVAWHGGGRGGGWHGNRGYRGYRGGGWGGGGYYYAPPPVVYGAPYYASPYYAPPPVVYGVPFGLNLNIR